jgi:hypothetical protein
MLGGPELPADAVKPAAASTVPLADTKLPPASRISIVVFFILDISQAHQSAVDVISAARG